MVDPSTVEKCQVKKDQIIVTVDKINATIDLLQARKAVLTGAKQKLNDIIQGVVTGDVAAAYLADVLEIPT